MFSNLMKFDFQRTGKQAFGFYIAWSLMGILFGAIAGMIGVEIAHITGSGPTDFAGGYKIGANLGSLVSIPYCLLLSMIVVVKKNLHFGAYALAVIGALLAGIAGCMLGLLPVAYLSTRASNGATGRSP